MNNFKIWPADFPFYTNGTSAPCDMLVGPCYCGATHTEGEFEMREGILYRYNEGVPSGAKSERWAKDVTTLSGRIKVLKRWLRYPGSNTQRIGLEIANLEANMEIDAEANMDIDVKPKQNLMVLQKAMRQGEEVFIPVEVPDTVTRQNLMEWLRDHTLSHVGQEYLVIDKHWSKVARIRQTPPQKFAQWVDEIDPESTL